MTEGVSVDVARTSAERELGGTTGQVGSKKKHTSTQERKHCLLIYFHPTSKPTNQQTYSPSVTASQRITW